MPPDSPQEAKRDVEQARLDLDERRFAYEQQLGQLRLELEKAKLKFDSRFAARHLGTFVTGLVSLAAVIVSVAQVWIAQSTKEKEATRAEVSQQMQRELTEAQQTREWNMKTAEFVATHWKLISDPQTQREMADIMLVVFPPKIANPLFRRLNSTAPGDTAPWNAAEKISASALLNSIESPDQPGWLPPDKYVEEFKRQLERNLYPAKVEGRHREGIDEYRAEWKPTAGIAAWQSYMQMSKEGFDLRNAEFTAQGYSVEWQSNFKDSAGNMQYLATWTRKF